MRKTTQYLFLSCGLTVVLACGGSNSSRISSRNATGFAAQDSAVCGNGVLELGEQCDDGNTLNLDGCNATCQFEQVQRANALTLETSTDAFCTANALGKSVSAAASKFQPQIDSAVKDGSATIMVELVGLNDLTGQSGQSVGLALGVLDAAPVAGSSYDGASDLDWWYAVTASSIDASRNPVAQLAATITAAAAGSVASSELAAQGTIDVPLALSGTTSSFHMSGAKIRAEIGTASAPTLSVAGTTPGHVASEHLDPTLTSFTDLSGGELCGNVSAAVARRDRNPGGASAGQRPHLLRWFRHAVIHCHQYATRCPGRRLLGGRRFLRRDFARRNRIKWMQTTLRPERVDRTGSARMRRTR